MDITKEFYDLILNILNKTNERKNAKITLICDSTLHAKLLYNRQSKLLKTAVKHLITNNFFQTIKLKLGIYKEVFRWHFCSVNDSDEFGHAIT